MKKVVVGKQQISNNELTKNCIMIACWHNFMLITLVLPPPSFYVVIQNEIKRHKKLRIYDKSDFKSELKKINYFTFNIN